MTDLCWECQRNNRDISTSSNLRDVVKQAKLKKQQAHLDLVFMERTFYQNMVKDAKAAYTAAGCPPLGPHPPCSTDFAVHLSFDYAQQVHLPSFPMQPGPLYFLDRIRSLECAWRASPGRSTTSLIRATVAARVPMPSYPICTTTSRTISVTRCALSYFENYGLGEKEVHLHCDNCSGQNKSWPTSCGELSQDVTSPSL